MPRADTAAASRSIVSFGPCLLATVISPSGDMAETPCASCFFVSLVVKFLPRSSPRSTKRRLLPRREFRERAAVGLAERGCVGVALGGLHAQARQGLGEGDGAGDAVEHRD